MYQQYADMFQNQANLGMMNAMGQAAAMTGGYGSSYGQMVGQQAFAQQMQGLNEVGMDLYGQALNQYMMEGDQLAQQYAMLAEREAQAYNRGLDQRNFEYQQMLDDRAQSNYEREFGYQQQRDTIADSQWDQTLQYQKDRDLVADSQWQAQMDYQTGRDSVADTQWQQQFESSEAQRAADNAYRDSMMQYQQIRDQVSDEQWRAELDRMLANGMQKCKECVKMMLWLMRSGKNSLLPRKSRDSTRISTISRCLNTKSNRMLYRNRIGRASMTELLQMMPQIKRIEMQRLRKNKDNITKILRISRDETRWQMLNGVRSLTEPLQTMK